MVNIKPVIVNALKSNLKVSALLGGPHIYRPYTIKEAPKRLITYAEIANEPFARGDERELATKIMIQLDLWVPVGESTSEMALAVDEVMTALGGERERAPDDDEDLPKESKTMVYSFIVDELGEIL